MASQARGVKSARHSSGVEFSGLLAKLPAAAYTCDAEGLITYFNDRAVELWGRAPKLNDARGPLLRLVQALHGRMVHRSSHEECWMNLALRDRKAYNGQEIVIERPDGSRVAALAHANPFLDENGEVAGAVNVLVDITDRKRSELARATCRRLSIPPTTPSSART